MPDQIRPDDNISQAEAEKQAAVTLAAQEAMNRDIAEARAVDAHIAAGQAIQAADEMATDRQVLRHELGYERVAASNSTFGFYLTLAVLVAGLLVGGFYLYSRSQNPDNVIVNAAPAPAPGGTVTVVPTPPAVAPPPPPVTVNNPPPVVHVTPPARPAPEVNVNVTPPPSGSAPGGSTPSSGTGAETSTGSGTDSGTSSSGSGG